MSASDLAPFVAAVLKDRTVAGMVQENNELKSKLTDCDNERLLVEVTGQHGLPIYYKGSMRNGGRSGDDHWCVRLEENNTFLPLIILPDLEIWLGGTLVHQFTYITDSSTRLSGGLFQVDNESDGGIGSIQVTTGAARYPPVVYCIFGKIGPMRRTDYEELSMMDVTQLMDLYQNRPALINVGYIMFDKKKIRGTMALLEKLGTDILEPFQPN
jgi:hypothetical protein